MPVKTRRKPAKRRKKAAPGSRGLSPAECASAGAEALTALSERVRSDGGAVLAPFKEPLGGAPVLLACLPVGKVAPTPFQRELSEAHAKRLSDAIDKLGHYLDPIIVVPVEDGYWTPNGAHRLSAMKRLGAKAVTALVLPEPELQYKILALNVEKAHNLRDKSLEVIRMYRSMAEAGTEGPELRFALEFEEPAFATLGLCYERNKRFGGGAYHPILKRVDEFFEEPLKAALKAREKRAARVEKLDEEVRRIAKGLEARGFKSPYLKAFVVARVNPLRFMEETPPFDEALDMILKRAERFDVAKVKQEDIAAGGGPPAAES